MGKSTSLAAELVKIDVLKLGEFVLKSKNVSPFYVDLRHIPCFPKVLNAIAQEIFTKLQKNDIVTDFVCGAPYNGIPIASVLSSKYEIPMLMKRKEIKTYGTKKLIEGIFKSGDRCVIIEDVVVSGASIVETACALRKEGLVVTDCVTVLDRLQGGKKNLLKAGIQLHSILDIREMFNPYCQFHQVDASVMDQVETYLATNICEVDVQSIMKSYGME